ncbi:MAG TPA: hypothetical protein VNM39_03335 [Verrucomicrobiae bacterium]|nr:hypothetical protein [Verrucomicrobiae bacterium]
MKQPPHLIHPVRYEINHSRRYMVAAKLARGIQRFCQQGAGACTLKGQAFVIEDVGFQERLSPAFMVGAAMTESSGGDAACGRNLWGLNSCHSGNFIHGPVPAFRDFREAFTYFARFVHERWPGARTVYDLVGYCGCGTAAWGNRTSTFMARMGFGGGRLSYP